MRGMIGIPRIILYIISIPGISVQTRDIRQGIGDAESARRGGIYAMDEVYVIANIMAKEKSLQIREEVIASSIHFLHGEKVMLDIDLAVLYGVETKQLKPAVKRNIERFPPDFMFELTRPEFENLRRQFGTSSWGGSRYPPYAFTEQGVAMLSSVLRSKREGRRGGLPDGIV